MALYANPAVLCSGTGVIDKQETLENIIIQI